MELYGHIPLPEPRIVSPKGKSPGENLKNSKIPGQIQIRGPIGNHKNRVGKGKGKIPPPKVSPAQFFKKPGPPPISGISQIGFRIPG